MRIMSEPPQLEERKEGRVRGREGEGQEEKREKTAGRENRRKGRKGGR